MGFTPIIQRRIHPAVALFLQAFFSVYLFFYNSPSAVIFFVLSSLSLLLYLRRWRRLLIFFLLNTTYLCLLVYLQQRAENGNFAQILLIASMFFFPFLCNSPLGSIVLLDTPVPDILNLLQSLRLPKKFILAFAIVLRFLPTYATEARLIRQSFKIRGIKLSWRHPLVSWGYLMMPVLLRLESVALELSAAAITRGIENPKPRTAYSYRKMKLWEKAYLLGVPLGLCAIGVLGL